MSLVPLAPPSLPLSYKKIPIYSPRDSLIISAPDTGSLDLSSILVSAIVLPTWARHFTLTVPLSRQECVKH